MDPNANLEEQLRIAKRLTKQIDKDHCAPSAVDTGRLCDLVITLDRWIREGGFLPKRWPVAK